MVKKGQVLKTRGFVREWKKSMDDPALSHLTEQQLNALLALFWNELTDQLSKGNRVIFEHWITFYTKPVRRKCFNIYTKEEWISHKNRVRTNILDRFRERAETELEQQ